MNISDDKTKTLWKNSTLEIEDSITSFEAKESALQFLQPPPDTNEEGIENEYIDADVIPGENDEIDSDLSDDCQSNAPHDFREYGDIDKMFDTLCEDALAYFLEINNVTIRYNVITRTNIISGLTSRYNPETIENDLPIIIHDRLKKVLKRCDITTIQNLLRIIAGKNRYNPVIDMLDSNTWDGKDRLEELYEILHISVSDKLSKTLIKKWLWQCLSMARNNSGNDAYGADGLLVLQGKQSIGKTSFVKKIAADESLCKLGQRIDSKDKDTYRRCGSAWIVELGEIESTLKSDIEFLKAFITAEIDEYRLPYGRSDYKLRRRTSFIGTCNSEQYLVDPTGSRRFWTVHITEIDFKRLNSFNSVQLWLQIDEEAKKDIQGFRLTKDEQDELAKRNAAYEKPLKGQEEVMDVLAKTGPNIELKEVSVTEFKENHAELRRLSARQIGAILDHIGGYEQRTDNMTVNGRRTSRRLRNLPMNMNTLVYGMHTDAA